MSTVSPMRDVDRAFTAHHNLTKQRPAELRLSTVTLRCILVQAFARDDFIVEVSIAQIVRGFGKLGPATIRGAQIIIAPALSPGELVTASRRGVVGPRGYVVPGSRTRPRWAR